MPRAKTPFLNSPEFRRLRGWSTALLGTFGALMAVAFHVQMKALAWAEGTEPVATAASAQDRTPAVQDEAYSELLKRAAGGKLGPGERVPYTALMENPAAHRAKTVRVEGVILGAPSRKTLEPVPLAPGEAPPELGQACEAVVLDPVAGTTYAVTFLEPGPRPAAHGRIVVEGAFWKVVTYQNRRGDVVAAPYLVARTWTLVPREEGQGTIPLLMGITGGLAIASIMIGAQASRRSEPWKA